MNPEQKAKFRAKNPGLFLGSVEASQTKVKTNVDLSSLTPEEKQHFKSLPDELKKQFVKERPWLVKSKEVIV